MSCNCIKTVRELVQNKSDEKYKGLEKIEYMGFEHLSINLTTGRLMIGLPLVGRYKRGKKIVKEEVIMYMTYCPFCGKKYEEVESNV